jgi:large subunit ribosomal protein L22
MTNIDQEKSEKQQRIEKIENLENEQLVSATSKYLRISPTKIDLVIAKIRGKSYREALLILKSLPQKAATIVWQTLYSAISNATNNFAFQKENLCIREAFVNQGPILKRMRPRAKGRGFAIQKKMAHLTIRVGRKENV